MSTKYKSSVFRRSTPLLSVGLLALGLLTSSGCKKKAEPAPVVEQSHVVSAAEQVLKESELLRLLPEKPVGLLLVDIRQLWTMTLSSLGDVSTRGELRARLGFAVDELGQTTQLIRYFGRPLTLSAATKFAVGEYGENGLVLIMDAKVLPELEEGYGPLPIREGDVNEVARRGDLLFVGHGESFRQTLNLADGKSSAEVVSISDQLSKDASSLGQWVSLGSTESSSVVKAIWGEESRILAALKRRTPIWAWIDPSNLAFRVGANGEVSLGFDGEKLAAHHALSLSYQSSFEELEGVINDVPAALQGWTNWVNLIVRGSWARLDFDDSQEMMWARVRGVDCGSPMRNLWVIGALWSSVNQAVLPTLIAEQAAHSERCKEEEECAEPEPSMGAEVEGASDSDVSAEREYAGRFENISMDFSESCDGIAGILPEIPLNLARLGGASSDGGVLLLADYGALIRTALPTGFNLLPFALSEASLVEAFGDQVMGLSSLRATDAKMGAYIEVASASGEKMMFVRMPSGLSAVVPPEIRKALTSEAGGMVQLASPGLEARLSNQGRDGWATVIREARSDSLLTLTGNRVMLEALSETVEQFSPNLSAMFLELDYLTLTIGSDFSLEFSLRLRSGTKPNEFIETYNRQLSATIRDLTKQAEFKVVTGFVPDVVRARFVEAFITQVRMEARGSSVSVRFGTLGRAMGVGFIGLGFYAALVPQKVFAEGGQIRGPLVPEIRDMQVIPRAPQTP